MTKPRISAAIKPGSRKQPYLEGKAIRNTCPRASHGVWKAPADRANTIEMLEASNQGRLPELIPVRYGRMIVSPFVFFRGAASIMAADLAHFADHRDSGPVLWRCSPKQLWGLCHTGATGNLRHRFVGYRSGNASSLYHRALVPDLEDR
jgi:hypothetical protein